MSLGISLISSSSSGTKTTETATSKPIDFQKICKETYPLIQPKSGFSFEDLHGVIASIRRLQFKDEYFHSERALCGNASIYPTMELLVTWDRNTKMLKAVKKELRSMIVEGSDKEERFPKRDGLITYRCNEGFKKEVEFADALEECDKDLECSHGGIECGLEYNYGRLEAPALSEPGYEIIENTEAKDNS